MPSPTPIYRALVFGASGITGWAVAREALNYPTPTTFDQVIGLTNRPLTKGEARLPEDERLQLYSGIDLTTGSSEVEQKLKQINGIEGVTHVYFSAYTGDQSSQDAIRANVGILQNAVEAVERLCPKFKVWVFQSGGKAYGFVHAAKLGLPATPLRESAPRIPQPYASEVMYYAQYDLLQKLSTGKAWKFIEIRPDAVVGFVPSNNAMNLAQSLALFFSFYASREGPGANVPYPGPSAAFKALYTCASQLTLANFQIYAALHPDTRNGETINIGDEDSGISWEQLWPDLTSYFGLVGTGPEEGFRVSEYMEEHREEWKGWVKRHHLKEGLLEGTDFGFLTMMMSHAVFDRQFDLAKARALGFVKSQETIKGYLASFELMRLAKIIP